PFTGVVSLLETGEQFGDLGKGVAQALRHADEAQSLDIVLTEHLVPVAAVLVRLQKAAARIESDGMRRNPGLSCQFGDSHLSLRDFTDRATDPVIAAPSATGSSAYSSRAGLGRLCAPRRRRHARLASSRGSGSRSHRTCARHPYARRGTS